MRIVYINGKFLSQRITGVQRQALGLLIGLDKILDDRKDDCKFEILCMLNASIPPLKNIKVNFLNYNIFGSVFWEQLVLPVYTYGSVLINLTGSASIFKSSQFCMIADAAIYEYPTAYSRKYRAWYKLLYWSLVMRSKNMFGTVSIFSKEQLHHYLKIPDSRIQVFYNTVEHFLNIDLAENYLECQGLKPFEYILAVGSLNPTKNLESLILAYIDAELPIPLVVVGGSNKNVFKDNGKTKASLSNVRYLGSVDDTALKTLYTSAKFFIFPSIYEGFGIPPLEAMICGCPVLASDIEPIREVCGNSVYYFNPHSIPSIKKAIVEAIGDDQLRDRLSTIAQQNLKRFDWRDISGRLIDTIESIH